LAALIERPGERDTHLRISISFDALRQPRRQQGCKSLFFYATA
jgi:hypothetical protein